MSMCTGPELLCWKVRLVTLLHTDSARPISWSTWHQSRVMCHVTCHVMIMWRHVHLRPGHGGGGGVAGDLVQQGADTPTGPCLTTSGAAPAECDHLGGRTSCPCGPPGPCWCPHRPSRRTWGSASAAGSRGQALPSLAALGKNQKYFYFYSVFVLPRPRYFLFGNLHIWCHICFSLFGIWKYLQIWTKRNTLCHGTHTQII